jgi:hypothetical protein
MSYVITKTNGSVLATTNMPGGVLTDGTTDSSTGLTFIGRNYPSYGELQNENFVRLLENFADDISPMESLSALSALTGTLWYDTANQKLKVYDGTNWNLVGGSIVSASEPTTVTYTLTVGDQWYNTATNQLNAWTGNTWSVLGASELANVQLGINANVNAVNAFTLVLQSNIGQLRADTGTYMTANVATINANIVQLRTDTGLYMTSNVATLNGTISSLATDVSTNYATKTYVNSAISSAATGSPTFTSPTISNALLTGTTTLNGSLIPSGNLTINLGSSTRWFDNIYGSAMHAQYADLAEKYLPDADYEIGTVVVIGGSAEITACSSSTQRAIGAISGAPAYIMNSGLEGGVYVALKGRVPVKVIGPVQKGDELVASADGSATVNPHSSKVFAVALETNTNTGVKLVEAVIL